jgi:hypothetical protein
MQRHNLNYFTEVSAKNGTGIEELVKYVSQRLYSEYKDKLYEFKDSETRSVSSHSKSKRGSYQMSSYVNTASSGYTVTGRGTTLAPFLNNKNAN